MKYQERFGAREDILDRYDFVITGQKVTEVFIGCVSDTICRDSEKYQRFARRGRGGFLLFQDPWVIPPLQGLIEMRCTDV